MSRSERFARRAGQGLVALAFALTLAAACSPDPEPEAGSETHFLLPCADGCPASMLCVCGVCTTGCDRAVDCGQHADAASCVPLSPRILADRCDDAGPASICDVECVQTVDCAALGASFTCQGGFCRTAPASPGPGQQTCAASGVTPTDVAILGDALIELTAFTAGLEERAVSTGLLAAGAHYRDYAAAATSFLAEGPFGLNTQYAAARAEGAPRVVIMNGGATDMLNNACGLSSNPDCPAIEAAVRGAERLFAEFAADSVEHVVYFFYPDPLDNPALAAGLDVLRPLVENVCGKSRVACHFLDLRWDFKNRATYLMGSDGIIFSEAGADAAANAVFNLMSNRCIAR